MGQGHMCLYDKLLDCLQMAAPVRSHWLRSPALGLLSLAILMGVRWCLPTAVICISPTRIFSPTDRLSIDLIL